MLSAFLFFISHCVLRSTLPLFVCLLSRRYHIPISILIPNGPLCVLALEGERLLQNGEDLAGGGCGVSCCSLSHEPGPQRRVVQTIADTSHGEPTLAGSRINPISSQMATNHTRECQNRFSACVHMSFFESVCGFSRVFSIIVLCDILPSIAVFIRCGDGPPMRCIQLPVGFGHARAHGMRTQSSAHAS